MYLNHLDFEINYLKNRNIHICLLSGDPLRTEMIAQQYLKNPQKINENRGLYCFTGETGLGLPILAATSGMGAPSTSIIVNELAQAGINVFIRIGTTGSIQPYIGVGSIIVNFASLCRQGAANDIAPRDYPAAASALLSTDVYYEAKKIHSDVYFGLNASVDTFYEGQERYDSVNAKLMKSHVGMLQEYQNLNILNFEMESGTLFKMANVYGLHATSICAVAAARCQDEALQHDSLQHAVDACIKAALLAAENIQKNKLQLFPVKS